jgi:hypothetical protein
VSVVVEGFTAPTLLSAPQGRAEQLSAPLPGEVEWKRSRWGRCSACGQPGPLVRHHVLLAQIVRLIAPERVWDLRNSMDLGMRCPCHERHHAGGEHRLPASAIPTAAIAFTRELLGDERARIYLYRRYNHKKGVR